MPRQDAKPVPIPPFLATHPFFESPLHEVNQRCLDLLVEAARRNLQPPPFSLITPLHDVLCSMTDNAKRQAARRPLLLVDLQFRDHDWWRRIAIARAGNGNAEARTNRTQRKALVQMSRATLMLTWHALRADPTAGCILLGIAQPVADLILTLKLGDIDRIAEENYLALRPRWEDRPSVWRELLTAAQSGDARALREFNVHAIQLLAGEFITAMK
jgi:hypothetical protein